MNDEFDALLEDDVDAEAVVAELSDDDTLADPLLDPAVIPPVKPKPGARDADEVSDDDEEEYDDEDDEL